MTLLELKEFLDEKAEFYQQKEFIQTDPIIIPHEYDNKLDIEISGFLISIISWGNRKSIINSGHKIITFLESSPYDFIINHSDQDLKRIKGNIHRTFNSEDLIYFIKSLKNIYINYNGLEDIMSNNNNGDNLQERISNFKKIFFELNHPKRTKKHLPDPLNGSAAKRFNMFLRWMVRSNNKGIDFGIWKSISPSQLSCPLDVHSGNTARKLGLLKRNQNDSLAVNELDLKLREMDKMDPVKYDFALFGLSVNEKF
ncbi:uncharacterized protein METZ01_LOCUS415054 [marine metagenome]|uniref:TIGR02757 family protein n=1 Tax=marine metagenome TaxID=408172 RepID=A0A382WUD8_9ZZZZ